MTDQIPNDKIKFVQTWPRGNDLFKEIAEVSPKILLSFSLGKDSIGAWLALRDSGMFEEIIPFYGYLVPDLKFVEDSLSYYEDFFQTKIHRYPSPSFYRMLKSGTFMPLWHNRFMRELDFDPNWDYNDLAEMICEDLGLDEDTFVATGIRAIDNMSRLAAMKKIGPITWNLLKFHPIWDWNKNMLMTRIHREEIDLPPDYLAFGRSYDGIDRRYVGPIKALWPDDYNRIREFFPLVDTVLWRERYARRHRF
jgi:3'-phosphoadenosine 5'-phosphosulfate sulfotransferase (PAPS reductase)/FAD synthetase